MNTPGQARQFPGADHDLVSPVSPLASNNERFPEPTVNSHASQFIVQGPPLPPYSEHDQESVQPALKTKGNSLPWKRLLSLPTWRRQRSGRSQRWKPMTLQAPVLGAFVVVSLTIVVILEFLSQKSLKAGNGGALAFATDVNSISTGVTFGFLFFPTILAVIYSLLWSWVDLDVKRLEPWFQLSQKQGAKADDSLLLQYPFDFLPFIPISAGRRRHWGVFLAGSIMILVFWAITPLQSAIFTTGTVTRTIQANMVTSATLLPFDQQSSSLNTGFQNTAYGVAWVNQTMPAFTTLPYNVLPFRPSLDRPDMLPTETWTTNVDAFSTGLTCTPATFEVTSLGYTFDNGRGCSVSEINFLVGVEFLVNYIGYFDSPHLDWSLQNPNCSIEFSNNYLAIWASEATKDLSSGVAMYSNLTAMFCETHYSVDKYMVTVNASNLAIVDGLPITGTANNTDPTTVPEVFNTTAFEYIISTGTTANAQNINLPERAVLDQFIRIQPFNLSWPVNPMVGFAVALNLFTIEELIDPVKLQTAFEKAHQLLFATAFSALLQPTNSTGLSSTDVRPSHIQDNPGAIVLVRPVSVAVETALALVSFLTILLWLYCHQRPSNLERDPASIADMMGMLHQNRILPKSFEIDEKARKPSLLASDSKHLYRLVAESQPERPSRASRSGSEANSLTSGGQSLKSLQRPEATPTLRPTELRLFIGGPFIFLLVISISGLVVLNRESMIHKGIGLPSTNPTVLSILENYLPTIFATFLEPIWVLLNRILCLLKPFDELRKGNAKASSSIQAKYTSLPPPLVIWRAIRSGHFLLAAVCVVSISTNLLAVSLSTLLNERTTLISHPSPSKPLYSPTIELSWVQSGYNTPSAPVLDHFEVLISNISHNSSLPSWLGRNQYFIPFTTTTPSTISNSISPSIMQGFVGSTKGLGVNTNCIPLTPGTGNNTYNFTVASTTVNNWLFTTHTLPNGTDVKCVPSNSVNGYGTMQADIVTGKMALEIMGPMKAADGYYDGGYCSALMIAGWIRGNSIPGTKQTNDTLGFSTIFPIFQGLTNVSFMTCSATPYMADYNIFVDPTGHVLTSNQTSQSTELSLGGNLTANYLMSEVVNLIAPFVSDGVFRWHNTSFTNDWISSLLVLQDNSQALVDPSIPPPKAEVLTKRVEDLYTQLFAIMLGLNAKNMFVGTKGEEVMEVQALAVVSRIFVSDSMFKVSIIILALHLIVAILYYSFRPKKFLSRMPTTIGVIMGYINGSRACADFSDGSKGAEGMRYSFGRLWGTDGRTRVGVERAERVVLLGGRGPTEEKGRTISFGRKGRSWSFGKRKEAGWI